MNRLQKSLSDGAIEASKQHITEQLSESGAVSDWHVFLVEPPVTVFVRGSRCQVTIEYHERAQVEIHAKLYHAFGLRFVTEQDEAGVYIVIKRRWLLGLVSRAEFTLRVPRFANLSFNLTPGAIKLDDINGRFELPPLADQTTTIITQQTLNR